MPPPVLVAGLDGRSLLLEASVLRRDGHVVEEVATARSLFAWLGDSNVRLVVLGRGPPAPARREGPPPPRSVRAPRHASILALIPSAESLDLDGRAVEAGANVVLRRPLDQSRLDSWVAKLLSVP